MIKPFLILVAMTFSFSNHAANGLNDISGIWNTGENTLIEIDTAAKPIVGKVIKTEAEKGKVGTVILSDFQQTKDGWQATIFAPKRKKHFPALLTLENDQLNIEIDVGFFNKDVQWQRHTQL